MKVSGSIRNTLQLGQKNTKDISLADERPQNCDEIWYNLLFWRLNDWFLEIKGENTQMLLSADDFNLNMLGLDSALLAPFN